MLTNVCVVECQAERTGPPERSKPHAMTLSHMSFDRRAAPSAQDDINALLNVPEILSAFQRKEHIVHQLYYILHILLGNHFHGSVHVFQW